MKPTISTLALILAATAGAFSAQAARAEGFGSARWTYAPNVWSVEGMRMPKHFEPAHFVQNGAVPQGSGYLGISPQLLAKPVPPPVVPQVQTQVAATPTVAQAAPKMVAPKYNSSFGKAGSLPTPPVVANNPGITPSTPQDKAQAGSLKPQAKAAPAKQLVAHHRSSQSVSGKLNKPKAPEGLVADAGKRIDSYGSGYTPGAFLPAAYNGDGSSSSADVHGKLMTHLHRK